MLLGSVKKILSGIPMQNALNVDAVSNPKAIAFFTEMAVSTF